MRTERCSLRYRLLGPLWLGLSVACSGQQSLEPRVPGDAAGASSGMPLGRVLHTGIASPLAQPTVSPGVLFLFDLEKRFAASVSVGRGEGVCRMVCG